MQVRLHGKPGWVFVGLGHPVALGPPASSNAEIEKLRTEKTR